MIEPSRVGEPMMASESDPAKLSPLSVEALFTEICTDIRETDSISFRLLGLVPLVSGAALLTLMLSKQVPSEFVMLLGIFGAGITLGLFRWELRNIQTCSWLLRRAERLQTQSLGITASDPLCKGRPDPPQGIGKTAAEKLIYGVTIATWLALPICLGSIDRLTSPAALFYTGLALLILGSTVVSLFANCLLYTSDAADE